MSDEERELCGKETSKGTPCQNYADTCPWDHDNGNDTGRPSKFNSERAQDAIEAAREGKSEAGCARASGVQPTTINNWKEANPTFEDESGTERDFLEAFTRARAKGESELIVGGLRDPDVDASFAKFLLASSFDYVKEEKRDIEHSGEIDGFDFTINASTDD